MKILLNASNIGPGGAAQVTISIAETLDKFPQHTFVVVLSPAVARVKPILSKYDNVDIVEYSVNRSISTKLTGRDRFLDNLVVKFKVDFVLSVFGPTWWVPKIKHLCGFALAHVVVPESPYFQRMNLKERLYSRLNALIMRYFYWRSSENFYTENAMITERLRKIFRRASVFTVTNYYNQIFEKPDRWTKYELPSFNGKTFITIASSYPHKNLDISIYVAKYLKQKYPHFSFRFVLTIQKSDFPQIPDELEDNFLFIGPVPIESCPSLYDQSDIVFQPTLLECFTAAYPEAMYMQKPIVTTDLPFARGLCTDAAIYYSPLSATDAAECLYKVSTDESMVDNLVNNGKLQLKQFDHYSERANKLIALCEQLYLK